MATKQEKEQKNIKNIQFAWIGKDKNKNEVTKIELKTKEEKDWVKEYFGFN